MIITASLLGSLVLPQSARGDRADVLDLRPGTASERRSDIEAIRRALAEEPGVTVATDPGAAAALARLPHSPGVAKGRRLARAALKAASGGACSSARRSARDALPRLVAAEPAGVDVGDDLVATYAAVLICADAAGDVDTAMSARRSLHALGSDRPPAGVSAEIWDRYPILDAATNVMRAELVVTEPAGAEVWIDHRPVGIAPVTAVLSQGPHWVASAGQAREVILSDWHQEVSLGPALDMWGSLQSKVAALRGGERAIDGRALGEVMREAKLDALVVLRAPERIMVWGSIAGSHRAQVLGGAVDGADAAARIARGPDHDGPGIDPNVPLLRESPEERARQYGAMGGDDEGQEWWVYASILGAVGLATAAILATEIGSDTQRIEVTLP